MDELKGRVALVTGAATGLGEAMARIFAREGAIVTIADIDEEKGREVAHDIGGVFQRLDVSDEQQWLAAIAALQQAHGRLDVLVNNAGIFHHNIPFLETSIESWRKQLSVNADGTFLGCKHGIKAMQGQGRGSIINIASTIALMALTTASAYATSKAAVLMITRLASRVGGPLGVRVNAILPGAVLTNQLRTAPLPGETIDDFIDKITPLYPLGRIARREDIAEAALFLASDRSSFVSGDLMRVDGAQDP